MSRKKVKRRRYSSEERLLYFLGYWDSDAMFRHGSRMRRLQEDDEYLLHPSYKAGKKAGEAVNKEGMRRFHSMMERSARSKQK